MTMHDRPRFFAMGIIILAMAGCRTGLPANYLSLVPAESDRAPYPVLRMTRGAIVHSENRSAMILGSRDAFMLFDYRGGENRVALLFRDGSDEGLYERIGQRQVGMSSADFIDMPQGITVRETGRRLKGTIDVFVAKSERLNAPDDPEFTEFPRAMRVVGYFAVPLSNLPDEAIDMNWFNDLEPDEFIDIARQADRILPSLPVVDVQYFVPTNLFDRLKF